MFKLEEQTVDMTPAEVSVWMDGYRTYVREFQKNKDNSIVSK